MIKKLYTSAAILCIVSVAYQVDAQVQDIYWFDYDENLVLRGNPETSNIDTLSQIQSRLPSAADLAGGELYWVDTYQVQPEPVVFRKGFPGNDNAKELFTLDWGIEVVMIRVDVENDYIYWLQRNPNSIRRARMNGTDEEEIVAQTDIGRFRVDLASEKLYWTEQGAGIIHRSNLDGSQGEEIIANGDFLRINDVEVDTANAKIYWTVQETANNNEAGIYQAGMNGEDVGLVIETVPNLLTYAGNENRLYWSEDADQRYIIRVSLDDGVADTILTESNIRLSPNEILFDQSENNLLWVEGRDGEAGFRIMQADADVSNVEEILPGFGDPVSVVIDPIEEKLYWTTGYFREVMKADLDGFNVQALVRELVALSTPSKRDIFLDRGSGTLYWGYFSSAIPGLFSQISINGDQFRNVNIPNFGANWLSSMAIDHVNEHLYAAVFTEPSPEPTILRIDANHPETGEVDVLLDESILNARVTGIGIDLEAGKLYWSEHGIGKIRRANLDGTSAEDLLSDLAPPSGIAMDVENGKIYWTEQSAGTISRANLDGTAVEELFTDLANPGRPYFTSENIGVSITLPPVTEPVQYSLEQNYPNPFNPVTAISFRLPVSGDVKLEVFDILGRRVAVLVDGIIEAGVHEAAFDASNLASGVYLYRLSTTDFVQTRQMVLVK